MVENNLKKILLVGPFSDFGGRELEAGFIASVLKEEYEVQVCSTGQFTHRSQLFQFVLFESVVSLNQLICQKNVTLRVLASISWFKNKRTNSYYNYVNNSFAKRFLGYRTKVLQEIQHLIQTSDVIFIVASLSSAYMKEVVALSKQSKKPVLFRTTNRVVWYKELEYSEGVDLFIHHSNANAIQIKLANHNYKIIDQCAFNEDKLVAIAPISKKVTHYLTLARLEPSKNIDVVIQAFLAVKEETDVLYIVGEGSAVAALKALASNEPSVIFTGFVTNEQLHDYFEMVDCVIISHFEQETGPLTGIEAMAAGRLIISAKTGAMPERLGNLGFWFDGSVGDLQNQINKVKRLDVEKANQISCTVREIYRSKYSKQHIAKEYRDKVQSQLF